MAKDYPYMISNNKIGPILQKILSAAKPSTFNHDLLKKLGFTSSNDRAVVPLLKKLRLLNEDSSPSIMID